MELRFYGNRIHNSTELYVKLGSMMARTPRLLGSMWRTWDLSFYNGQSTRVPGLHIENQGT